MVFLGIQDKWAEDSPHCLVILYEMFRHAAVERQKEAECIVCRGHWQNMPQLNPEAGIPAIQLVSQKQQKKSCLSYIWKYISCIDCQDPLLESQQYLKKCCPPSQTTKDVRRKRLLWPQCSLVLKAPFL